MEIFLLILRIVLAVIFLIASVGKLTDREGSEKAIRDFEIPEPIVKPAAAVLPWLELAVAFGLLFASIAWYAALGAAVLLAAFTVGMLIQYLKGNAPDCHCFGQIHSEPVGLKSILRNVVIAVPAAVLLISGPSAQGMDLAAGSAGAGPGIIGIAAGALIVALLTALLALLWKVTGQQALILRRIEILEVLTGDGREIERDEVVSRAHPGMPLGSPFPLIDLFDTAGKDTDSRSIVSTKLPSLVLFVGPSCHPCESLIPDIEKWTREFEGKLQIVLFSTGTIEQNLAKFGTSKASDLFIQKDQTGAEMLGAIWTPTAILLDKEGRIASRNALGDSAIRTMVEAIRGSDLSADYFHYLSPDEKEGMRIGEPIPEFSLDDLEGRPVSPSGFAGKKTLVTFWSTTCPFCIDMIEELKDWYANRSDSEPELVVFSAGDPDHHKALGLSAPILLENEYVTAAKLGMNGTPSAILVDENGRIASETGVGADMIWALLGSSRRRAPENNGS